MQHARAVTLVLAGGLLAGVPGCEKTLQLDRYHFGPADPGSLEGDQSLDSSGGGAGTGNTGRAGGGRDGSGSDGVGGSAGTSGGGSAGNDGQSADAGALDAGGLTDSGSGGSDGSGSDASGSCAAAERCVPEIPVGWQGPLVIGNGVGSCPGEYSISLPDLHAGFQAGAASCTPSCLVTDVQCQLHLENDNSFFAPSSACQHPPDADECLRAVPVATCQASVLSQITPSSFSTTNTACGGALPSGACGGGTCYPSGSSFGSLCISSPGDVSCPAEFPARVLRYAGLSDTRECSTVTCNARDQLCSLDLVLCDLGSSTPTISSTDTDCLQLNTSDGDGVQPGPTPHIDDTGGCDTSGGTLTGTAEATDPVTLCCLQ